MFGTAEGSTQDWDWGGGGISSSCIIESCRSITISRGGFGKDF